MATKRATPPRSPAAKRQHSSTRPLQPPKQAKPQSRLRRMLSSVKRGFSSLTSSGAPPPPAGEHQEVRSSVTIGGMRIVVSPKPVLDAATCTRIISEAEALGDEHGWKDRGGKPPSQDQTLNNFPKATQEQLMALARSMVMTIDDKDLARQLAASPQLLNGKQFTTGIDPTRDLVPNGKAFVIRYKASNEKKFRGLKRHLDGKCVDLTLLVTLSDRSEYDGGGTVFYHERHDADGVLVLPDRGHALMFQGNRTWHEGRELSAGSRYLLCILWKDVRRPRPKKGAAKGAAAKGMGGMGGVEASAPVPRPPPPPPPPRKQQQQPRPQPAKGAASSDGGSGSGDGAYSDASTSCNEDEPAAPTAKAVARARQMKGKKQQLQRRRAHGAGPAGPAVATPPRAQHGRRAFTSRRAKKNKQQAAPPGFNV